MSHEISRENGKDEAFYTGEPAWHGLGTVVKEAPTAEKAIELAHLDWKVEKFPLQAIVGDDKIINIENRFATVRIDVNRALGVVGKNYHIVQNNIAFNFVDSLVHDGSIRFESAGALKGGCITWILARFPGEFFIKDDEHRHYILMINSHDGSKAVRILPTNVRVVCWNTLSVALRSNQEGFVMRHSQKINDKLEAVRERLGILTNINQQIETIMKELADKPVVQSEVDKFIDQMFPLPPAQGGTLEVVKKNTRMVNIRKTIEENFNLMNTTATSGTRFGLLNAVTQYTDHQRSTSGKDDSDRAGNRFNSIFFGSSYNMKEQAFALLQKPDIFNGRRRY